MNWCLNVLEFMFSMNLVVCNDWNRLYINYISLEWILDFLVTLKGKDLC